MTDSHGREGPPPTLLYDASVRTPTHAERVRTLLAGQGTATLSTLAIDPAGHPYGTYVTYAMSGDVPVLLLSRIAEHTKNLVADSRVSLLVHETGKADPLANARATLVGRAEALADDPAAAAKSAFLAAHPYAQGFADYEDFAFYGVQVERARYIGGYGRMSWVTAEAFREAEPDPLGRAMPGIVGHMNDDHADALVLYCRAFSRATDTERATMTGIDAYGFDMSAYGPFGQGPVRISFDKPIRTAKEAREILVALVSEARAKLAEPNETD